MTVVNVILPGKTVKPMQVKVKAKGAAQPLVITANRLGDGRVVWLADAGRWSEAVADAAVFLGEAVSAGMVTAVQSENAQYVVGPYEVEVAATPAGPQPLRARERYRAEGPSIPVPAAA
jgi:Protein of unknown function (DUF2849)